MIGSDNVSGVADLDESPRPGDVPGELARVLESAARLQKVVPDAVLVGGSAAALYAGHRVSFDHDHVVTDLAERFEAVLDAVESTQGWVTNRVTPYKVVLGQLGDIEAGVRQLRRARPLEVTEVRLPSGRTLRVPAPAETLRIKAYLITARNRVRDFLDVAARSDRYGVGAAAAVLLGMDEYYADQRSDAGGPGGVAAQVVRQLSDPRPRDTTVLSELSRYRGLATRWQDWDAVREQCAALADAVLDNAVPDTAVPDTAVPDTAAPDAAVQDAAVQDAAGPGSAP